MNHRGVVSGCRVAMKYHRYTLANNRGDRNDLWPVSTLIYHPVQRTYTRTCRLYFFRHRSFSERSRWSFFSRGCLSTPLATRWFVLSFLLAGSAATSSDEHHGEHHLTDRRDNIYVTSFRSDDLSLNRCSLLIYNATIEGC